MTDLLRILIGEPEPKFDIFQIYKVKKMNFLKNINDCNMLLNSNIVTTCESDYFTNLLSKLATHI